MYNSVLEGVENRNFSFRDTEYQHCRIKYRQPIWESEMIPQLSREISSFGEVILGFLHETTKYWIIIKEAIYHLRSQN